MKKLPTYLFTILRIIVGWHFLYEGIAKIISGSWSSAPYLAGSRWIFAPFFHWIAENNAILGFIDFLNIWGMVLVGLGLMLGLFTRWASAGGAMMLFFFFVAYPPIPGYMVGVPAEGSYLWVNRNLIECLVLITFIFVSPGYMFGLDRLYFLWREEKARRPVPEKPTENEGSSQRREVIRNLISLPVLGAFAYALYKKNKWDSFEENLLKIKGVDASSGATLLQFNYATLQELKGEVPKGVISYKDIEGNPAKFELSRLIAGGNLIGGWAHARDLIYVSNLVKAYHTDQKVMQTLELAEKCGINALINNPQLARVLQKYKHEFKSNMKFISDCQVGLDFQEGIRRSLEGNFDALYCGGEITDRFTNEAWADREGRTVAQRMDLIRQGLEEIRSHGKPAGIGAHRLDAVKVCVDYGLKPDFWMKTLHHHNYWSAQVAGGQPVKDNLYCDKPQETIDFMNNLEEPWIAFKILAAGAIQPKDGFSYAFNNGADFICVGMYDFQIVDDVNILLDTLANVNRIRPWRG